MLAYLAVEIEKCDHQEGHKFIRAFSSAIGITQVFKDIHGGAEVSKTANFRASIMGGWALKSMTLWQSAICWPSQRPLLTKPWKFIYLNPIWEKLC